MVGPIVAFVALVGGMVAAGASPASAACSATPTVAGGTATVCVDVIGDPVAQVDTAPAVDAPVWCGFAGLCFAVGWDGVTTHDVTVAVSVTSGSIDHSFRHTIPGGSSGPVCFFIGGLGCPQ